MESLQGRTCQHHLGTNFQLRTTFCSPRKNIAYRVIQKRKETQKTMVYLVQAFFVCIMISVAGACDEPKFYKCKITYGAGHDVINIFNADFIRCRAYNAFLLCSQTANCMEEFHDLSLANPCSGTNVTYSLPLLLFLVLLQVAKRI